MEAAASPSLLRALTLYNPASDSMTSLISRTTRYLVGASSVTVIVVRPFLTSWTSSRNQFTSGLGLEMSWHSNISRLPSSSCRSCGFCVKLGAASSEAMAAAAAGLPPLPRGGLQIEPAIGTNTTAPNRHTTPIPNVWSNFSSICFQYFNQRSVFLPNPANNSNKTKTKSNQPNQIEWNKINDNKKLSEIHIPLVRHWHVSVEFQGDTVDPEITLISSRDSSFSYQSFTRKYNSSKRYRNSIVWVGKTIWNRKGWRGTGTLSVQGKQNKTKQKKKKKGKENKKRKKKKGNDSKSFIK